MSKKPEKIVLEASKWLPRFYSIIGVDGKLAVIATQGRSNEQTVRKDFESHVKKGSPAIQINFFPDVRTAQAWLDED